MPWNHTVKGNLVASKMVPTVIEVWRGLAMEAIALLELGRGQLAASAVATTRTHEAVGPSPLVQGAEALLFGSVEREELVEADAFLELHHRSQQVYADHSERLVLCSFIVAVWKVVVRW